MDKKHISAVVLAGGNSKRMGHNKALLQLGSITMIERIVTILQPLFNEVIVVTNSPDTFSMLKDVKFVPDYFITNEKNSLIGLYSGLRAAENEYVFAVACDMPLLNKSIIKYMIDVLSNEEDVLIPYLEGHYQPLHAIYGKKCLRPIEEMLSKEEYKIINFFNEVKVEKVDESAIKKFDIDLQSFININTFEEYVKIKRMI
ncbi:molybdenum cofactor guanylyltransferase [Alkaliphilus peptidifermentans]|uniref:Probable molybdenum cofactor guanylyltransferase n=1 Tax=Alkaliphilus peptidifermentans DSM 18978 TaxID=1120976 RepID=A0A1G5LA80_9FIRM|nr:molybdenum cofactor guanylyltransferase [Alkaliphilus peptidifermentans]SCZ09170.1 molybdenum cofactor guanylyltransferase [Alkaliphilus peptidifermentans DSM 18978]